MASEDFLDNERKKLWHEVRNIQESLKLLRADVDKRTPEHEANSRQASKKASEYRNRIIESKETVDSVESEILLTKEMVQDISTQIGKKHDDATSLLKACKEAKENYDAILEQSGELEILISKHEQYASIVEDLNSFHKTGEDTSSKINLLYTSSSKKKSDIDDIHLEIFGYEEEDEETGEAKTINGLKSELETSYKGLKEELVNTSESLNRLVESSKDNYNSFISEQGEDIESKFESWDTDHIAIKQKITDLLPGALTKGLSSAFSEKRRDEIKAGKGLDKTFQVSIIGLVLISLIPFLFNAYQLANDIALNDVIHDMPRLLSAIIPLYIPLLWLAYSSNKKSNLSKRLVEEYTHKEVLSKTFEGLSSQVETIKQEKISEELRIKLLYNLLEVSAENPGKLISNYDKSDHPLMDALDRSSKLNESIKKLDKIPGMSKLSEILDKRAKQILDKQAEKISETLDAVTSTKT